MTDYSEMSDFEINKRILRMKSGFTPLIYAHDADKRSAGFVDINGVYHWFDFCNSWADAGPTIQEHGICIGYDGISWDASCHFRDIKPVSDWKNHPYKPLRMAMIVFLMMQEGK